MHTINIFDQRKEFIVMVSYGCISFDMMAMILSVDSYVENFCLEFQITKLSNNELVMRRSYSMV